MLHFQPLSKKPFTFTVKDSSDKTTSRQSPLLLLSNAHRHYQLGRWVEDASSKGTWVDDKGNALDASAFEVWAPIGEYYPPPRNERESLAFDAEELLDDDGYPTEYALWKVESHSLLDAEGLFEFVEKIWHLKDFGYHCETLLDGQGEKAGKRISLSTAGWSGNESIIAALERNIGVWGFCWRSSRMGGHYEFEIKD